ncbi:hypothetical protein [Haliangium ochraceum]|uniref:UmuC domain-containing protein n=1 Tax=Haliangium ochraceum (strain DSM 14365 / JCM 11303 / SMP-2) TaxID=502025 RepID=D0LH57_HALO1|nr:hypothetical protein [Haliangium ochraceum]ACY18202.1 hypothetical protein Hoch_5725 [Haliangium ochraceum DSM 14365]
MRIACVYLPSFPLQAHVRELPHLLGEPLAVVDSSLNGSTVIACSRAAWEEGIRPGMATATARAIVPELSVEVADPALYERAAAALVEGLLEICEVVDPDGELGTLGLERGGLHRAIYVQAPPRMRGDALGHKIITMLGRHGFRGRVGVADDRFTAYVAAVTVGRGGKVARIDESDTRPPLFHQSFTTVPRGGSASFLAPLPLSFLPIDDEVQSMLHTCGVKTLGDFAALPPPSVSRALHQVDFRALARGEGSRTVRGVVRGAQLQHPVVECITLPAPASAQDESDVVGAGNALRTLCDRVAHRMVARDRAVTGLSLRAAAQPVERLAIDVAPERPLSTGNELLEAVRAAAEEAELDLDALLPGAQFALTVTGESERENPAMELFAPSDAVPTPVSEDSDTQPLRRIRPSDLAQRASARAEFSARTEFSARELSAPPLRGGRSTPLAVHGPLRARRRRTRQPAVQQQLF